MKHARILEILNNLEDDELEPCHDAVTAIVARHRPILAGDALLCNGHGHVVPLPEYPCDDIKLIEDALSHKE